MGTPAKKIQETSRKADYIPLYEPIISWKDPKPKTAQALQRLMQHYLDWCKDNSIPPVLSGLELSTGLEHNEFDALEKKEYRRMPEDEREAASKVIKMYKRRVKVGIDQRLASGVGGAQIIFYSKNALGYSDNYQISQKMTYDVSPQLQQLASQIVSKLPAPPSALPGQPSTPPEIVVQPTQEPDSDD